MAAALWGESVRSLPSWLRYAGRTLVVPAEAAAAEAEAAAAAAAAGWWQGASGTSGEPRPRALGHTSETDKGLRDQGLSSVLLQLLQLPLLRPALSESPAPLCSPAPAVRSTLPGRGSSPGGRGGRGGSSGGVQSALKALPTSSAGSMLLRYVLHGDMPRKILDALDDSALPRVDGGSEAWACSLGV